MLDRFMLTEIDRLTAIREARPEESLFAEKEWLISPEPFAIEEKLRADLERLGHQLFVFQRACNQLYQQSVKGKQPEWVARYLDIGKPPDLVEYSRQKEFRDALPARHPAGPHPRPMRGGRSRKSIPFRAELD